MYENEPGLTRKQRTQLWTLVRAEAVRHGYGTEYTESNLSAWPQRLKELAIIARKLRK